jgi:hypothetical protein
VLHKLKNFNTSFKNFKIPKAKLSQFLRKMKIFFALFLVLVVAQGILGQNPNWRPQGSPCEMSIQCRK